MTLRRFFPFLAWAGELRDPRVWRADLVAGITVALVLVPQSMAYAQLAGLPAYYGLYGALLPTAIAALWGSSRQLATGPVAMVSLMTGAALAPFAASGQDVVSLAIVLSLVAGVFQLGLGFLRLGLLGDFLSHPVLIGFTNAAALVIATSQFDKLLGVRGTRADHHYQTVWNTCQAAAHGIFWPALGMAVLAMAIMVVSRRLDRRIPGVLLAVVVTTVLSWQCSYFHEQQIELSALSGTAAQLVRQWQADGVAAREIAPRLVEAEDRHKATQHTYGVSHALTVEARLAARELAHDRDMLQQEAQLHWEALRGLRYRRVSSATGATFYAVGELPADQQDDSKEWRLRAVTTDGRIKMVTGGNIIGLVPKGLPAIRMPGLRMEELFTVLSSALLLSLIGFVEAIAIAKAMALRTRQRVDANQELIGQGLANLTGALTQAYPVSGSFSRSAVNLSAGAITGFSSVIASVMVAITLLWLTPLLWHLPEATLAAVIMMAVINLIRIKPILHAWKVSRRDVCVAVATFLITLLTAPHMEVGILSGVVLSLVAYFYTTMRPQVAALSRHPDGTLRDAAVHGLPACEHVLVLRFDGLLYFANTSHFEDRLIDELAARPLVHVVVLAGAGLHAIDATGEDCLNRLVNRLEEQGISVVFWGLRHRVQAMLQRTGLVARLGAERFIAGEQEALALAHKLSGCPDGHLRNCPLRQAASPKTSEC